MITFEAVRQVELHGTFVSLIFCEKALDDFRIVYKNLVQPRTRYYVHNTSKAADWLSHL